MARIHNRAGGGSQTNVNGLQFERDTSLLEAINNHDLYTVKGNQVFDIENNLVAEYYEKYELYKKLLEPKEINYKTILSKKLLPDGALLVEDTIYIVEKKFQNRTGSVDEKLQTCDFKKKQYIRLFESLNISVEYYYILNNWYSQDCYRDVFNYIVSVGCKYFIEEVPLSEFGL